ncbi:MAG: phosphate regulon sensor histidine kinase PhoR [Xanthomonadales bacterium]|jgi:two-component system phosphate regulon sensor histidine kinase PhoR|nr:phosphate regulon sensor histidine kinase PhoR [Xanthomonadales bacterium]
MRGPSWKRHVARLLMGAAAVVAIGYWTGTLLPAVLIGLAAYTLWLLGNMARLYRWLDGEEPEPPESLGVWSDIFERIHQLQKGNREQLDKNERIIREFRSITDAFPDSLLVLDGQDAIAWFNGAASMLLGLKTPDDIGQPVTNLLRDPEFADWMSVQDQVSSAFEMTSPRDSNRRLSVSAVHYREDQRLLILRDITDIHNLEQVRRDFVANVSHELRTPLTVLLGYLESLRDDADDEFGPALARMQEQGWQMQSLLNDLLELSRLQAESQTQSDEEISICATLLQLREQAEEISQGRHTIEVRCENGLALLGNEKDLESAFRNLIANAIHYTPAGGDIRISWNQTDEGPAFSVSDTGIGIPRRDIPRLTERFYRVGSDRSRHTGGTGLGLSIVKHVLNAHGARLQIDSELGEGSTFTCVFPPERTRQINESPLKAVN